jgi:hypothetical protein
VPEVHKYIGFAVVAIFAVGWTWGLGAWLFRRGRGPGDAFWVWLTVAQVIAGMQALAGIVLLILGYRPTVWLHYVYGFGPIVILVIAHNVARDQQEPKPDQRPFPPWAVFAAASFVCFGLTLRALMTGLAPA